MRCSYSDKVGRKQAEQQKAWSKVYTGGSCIEVVEALREAGAEQTECVDALSNTENSQYAFKLRYEEKYQLMLRLFLGCLVLIISFCFAEVTWVYICVVVIELCPSNF